MTGRPAPSSSASKSTHLPPYLSAHEHCLAKGFSPASRAKQDAPGGRAAHWLPRPYCHSALGICAGCAGSGGLFQPLAAGGAASARHRLFHLPFLPRRLRHSLLSRAQQVALHAVGMGRSDSFHSCGRAAARGPAASFAAAVAAVAHPCGPGPGSISPPETTCQLPL